MSSKLKIFSLFVLLTGSIQAALCLCHHDNMTGHSQHNYGSEHIQMTLKNVMNQCQNKNLETGFKEYCNCYQIAENQTLFLNTSKTFKNFRPEWKLVSLNSFVSGVLFATRTNVKDQPDKWFYRNRIIQKSKTTPLFIVNLQIIV